MIYKCLLQAKAWIVFLLSFGALFASHGLMLVAVGLLAAYGKTSYLLVIAVAVFLVVALVTISLWLWAVAVHLKKRVPKEITVSSALFKVIFFMTLLCIIAFFLLVLVKMFMSITIPRKFQIVFYLLLLFPHGSIVYLVYFAAKIIKTIELNCYVTFSDFAGEFFLILVFPIGLWIIQPRINKMAAL